MNKITSAKFVKSVSGTDGILDSDIPKVAFIGRSNVGKSSVINSLTGQKGLAITSSFPGRTQKINLFLINDFLYFVDLPGYGYARSSRKGQDHLQKLIYWYLLDSQYTQKKVVLIIDAFVGPTKNDMEMLRALEDKEKTVIIVANKIDKIKKIDYDAQIENLKKVFINHALILYSAEKKTGINELATAILDKIKRSQKPL